MVLEHVRSAGGRPPWRRYIERDTLLKETGEYGSEGTKSDTGD